MDIVADFSNKDSFFKIVKNDQEIELSYEEAEKLTFYLQSNLYYYDLKESNGN